MRRKAVDRTRAALGYLLRIADRAGVARFFPMRGPRRGGQWKGRVSIREQFDEFDEELDRLFYGGCDDR
jgi:hypothetical protein